MNRMRKGLAALAAAVFFLSVGGVAQAVIGVPDDVPASTLLYPFFKINPNRSTTDAQDTLLVVTNTSGPTSLVESAVSPNVAVHVTLWSATSTHVYDFSIILTPHDVWSCSLFDLIMTTRGCAQALPAPLTVRDALKTVVDGKDALVGYATADVVYQATSLFPGQANYPFGYGNVLIGHMYLVNLVNGSSTGFNAVSLETEDPCYGQQATFDGIVSPPNQNALLGFYRTRCEEEQGGIAFCRPSAVPAGLDLCTAPILPYGDYTERIDGPNGDLNQTVSATSASPLSLIVRYFSANAIQARTEVWLWKDRNTTASGGAVNVAVYDEDENVHSVQFNLPNEVNFALTNQIITPGAPGGWFRVKFPCDAFSSCGYNYATPGLSTLGSRPPIQSVAYSLQFAQSSNASLRWDAAFPAHRQYTNYIRGNE